MILTLRRTVAGAAFTVLGWGVARFTGVIPPHPRAQHFPTRSRDDKMLIFALRLVAAAEDDYRLEHGVFSARYSDLRFTYSEAPEATALVTIDAATTSGWLAHAKVRDGSRLCWLAVHVGPSEVKESGTIDGDPTCADGVPRDIALPTLEGDDAQPETRRPSATGDWPQYRQSSEKSGAVAAPGFDGRRWSVVGAPSYRASPSATSDLLLVGAHGSGVLTAYDLRDGAVVWRNRAPNWIHQDAVVHGSVVLVGFGDSHVDPDSITGIPTNSAHAGWGPGGIVAFDLVTGRRLWTSFVNTDVMTSPVVADSLGIFGTGDAHLIAVDLRTGAPVWNREIPGRVVMASPAFDGSRVFVTQEPDITCAFEVATGATDWCTRLVPAGFFYAGHSSPTVVDGTVYVSGVRNDSTRFDMIHAHDWRAVVTNVYERVCRCVGTHGGGHYLFALDARSGKELWRRNLGEGFPPIGHTSGTVVVDSTSAYVVSPLTHAAYALDRSTGALRWKVDIGSGVRGPPTPVAGSLLIADQSGVLHVVSEYSGRETCRTRLPDRIDRAGPTVVGGTAFFAGLSGKVFAFPLRDLRTCPTAIATK